MKLSDLLDRVSDFIGRYVVMSRAQRDLAALWVTHTHAFAAAEFTPYLAVTSAEKRCGKTTLLEVLAQLAANPIKSGSLTTASVKRIAEKPPKPTLFIDEADAAFAGSKDFVQGLRGLLNEGFYAGGKAMFCIERGNANYEPVAVSVFCPKAIAAIGKLPDTVADRAIPIRLRRRRRDEQVEKFRLRHLRTESKVLREELQAWAASAIDELTLAEPDSPDDLDDRAADILEPLFAIADTAGKDWPMRAREAALELTSTEREDDSIGVRLLRDIRLVFTEQRISSHDLVSRLEQLEESPWGGRFSRDWRGEWEPKALASLLRPYGIRPTALRGVGGKSSLKGYERVMFEDAWERFLPPEDLNNVNNVNGVPVQSDSVEGVADVDPWKDWEVPI
jgi:hypothetical protein